MPGSVGIFSSGETGLGWFLGGLGLAMVLLACGGCQRSGFYQQRSRRFKASRGCGTLQFELT
ncbi:MAG TPA: hypothetical protein DDZ51_16065 [Planctomycetaceae bacterium]|nr:hypothetical protein [Planctomycetaceae bacterium]